MWLSWQSTQLAFEASLINFGGARGILCRKDKFALGWITNFGDIGGLSYDIVLVVQGLSFKWNFHWVSLATSGCLVPWLCEIGVEVGCNFVEVDDIFGPVSGHLSLYY